jgi:hypothetical protein
MASYATGRLSTVEFFTDYKGLAQTVITLIGICNDLLALHLQQINLLCFSVVGRADMSVPYSWARKVAILLTSMTSAGAHFGT